MFKIRGTFGGTDGIFGVNKLDAYVPRLEELPNETDPYWLGIATLALKVNIGFSYEVKNSKIDKQKAIEHLNVVISSVWHNLPMYAERLAFLMSEWFLKPEEEVSDFREEVTLVAKSNKKLRGGGV